MIKGRGGEKMIGILIAAHHNLAKAYVDTVEVIAGKHDYLESQCLLTGQDPEEFGQLIQEKIKILNDKGFKEIIVMLDLFGGTPYNQTVKLLRDFELNLVVGVNLPMILQTVMSNQNGVSVKKLVEIAISSGKENIFDASELIRNMK